VTHIIALVGECPSTCDYVHKTLGLLSDGPHITAEIIVSVVEEVVVFTLGYWWAKKRIWKKLHDKFDRDHGLSHD